MYNISRRKFSDSTNVSVPTQGTSSAASQPTVSVPTQELHQQHHNPLY